MQSCTSCSLSGRQLQVSFVRPQITDSSKSHREAEEPNLAEQCDKCDDGLDEWEGRGSGGGGWGGVSRKRKVFEILWRQSG